MRRSQIIRYEIREFVLSFRSHEHYGGYDSLRLCVKIIIFITKGKLLTFPGVYQTAELHTTRRIKLTLFIETYRHCGENNDLTLGNEDSGKEKSQIKYDTHKRRL